MESQQTCVCNFHLFAKLLCGFEACIACKGFVMKYNTVDALHSLLDEEGGSRAELDQARDLKVSFFGSYSSSFVALPSETRDNLYTTIARLAMHVSAVQTRHGSTIYMARDLFT